MDWPVALQCALMCDAHPYCADTLLYILHIQGYIWMYGQTLKVCTVRFTQFDMKNFLTHVVQWMDIVHTLIY